MFQELLGLLLGNGVLSENSEWPVLVFSLGCFITGGAVTFLDYVLFLLYKTSVLKLNHKDFLIVRNILLWSVGSFFGGLIGAGFGIFQTNRIACITVGVGWPLILPRLMKNISDEIKEEVQSETKEERNP